MNTIGLRVNKTFHQFSFSFRDEKIPQKTQQSNSINYLSVYVVLKTYVKQPNADIYRF